MQAANGCGIEEYPSVTLCTTDSHPQAAHRHEAGPHIKAVPGVQLATKHESVHGGVLR